MSEKTLILFLATVLVFGVAGLTTDAFLFGYFYGMHAQ